MGGAKEATPQAPKEAAKEAKPQALVGGAKEATPQPPKEAVKEATLQPPKEAAKEAAPQPPKEAAKEAKPQAPGGGAKEAKPQATKEAKEKVRQQPAEQWLRPGVTIPAWDAESDDSSSGGHSATFSAGRSASLRTWSWRPTRPGAHHQRMPVSGISQGTWGLPLLDGVGKTGSGGGRTENNTARAQRMSPAGWWTRRGTP